MDNRSYVLLLLWSGVAQWTVTAQAQTSGDAKGVDFTRICWNGAAEGTVSGANTCAGRLVANTTGIASHHPATDWACTRDNATGLIWSLQTQSSVTWVTATAARYSDAGHNTPARCGYSSGWRIPSRRELLSIVDNGLDTGPMVNAAYFPATQSHSYWTSDTYAPFPSGAWLVYFNSGYSGANLKTYKYFVRLVRTAS